jgi:hypothetical protein
MFIYFIILILICALSFISFQFYKYKQIVNEKLKFYEDKLEQEESEKKEIIAEYDSKKHLLENPRPEDFNVENKDIKQDLDQRTDKIYDYLTKISNQIDYLHYHQLNIPQIESKISNLKILDLEEHHNYIEYILQLHNIKSEIDYFSHSLIAIEIKILPFVYFIKGQEKNIIIDTKLLQFILEFNKNQKVTSKEEAKDIFSNKLNKYFDLISNKKYRENIESYFIEKKIINSDQESHIITIVPTKAELNLINDHYLNKNQDYHLIDLNELYKFL